MAIPFLNNITLNNNEIQNVRLQNASSPPLSSGSGQVYFNTGDTLAKYYSNVTDEFVSLKEYTFPTGNYVTGTVTGTTPKPIITFDLNAIDGVAAGDERYLTKNNTWAEVSGISGTTYDLEGVGSINGTAGVRLSGSDATNDDVLIIGTGTTTVTRSGYILTVTSNDQFDGTVTSVTKGPGITVTPSATSPTVAVDYLGSDNYIVIRATDVADSDDSIPFNKNNDSDTVKKTTLGTIPVEALSLVKNYIDSSVSGGVYYQGGYDATNDLTSPGGYGLQTPPNPNIIEIGWMYTVTVEGLFFGEQLRVGDVLIAEVDGPTSLADWTTVQNNIDLATSSIVGLGNVVPGSSNTVTAPYSSGTATLDVVDSTPTQKGAVIVDAGTGISVAYLDGTAIVTNTQTNSDNTYAVTISDTAIITHGLGTKDVIIQLYDVVTNETVYADIARVNISPFNAATITFSATPTNDVRVLVQKIG